MAATEMTCRVRLEFGDPQSARAVASATAIDNPHDGTRQRVVGRAVVFEAGPAAPRSLRETLDDWLRCATAAAEAVRRAR